MKDFKRAGELYCQTEFAYLYICFPLSQDHVHLDARIRTQHAYFFGDCHHFDIQVLVWLPILFYAIGRVYLAARHFALSL